MDNKEIVPRIGTFFIMIGFGFVLLFVISDLAESVYFDYFFIGLFFAGFGIFLRRKAEPPPPSERFSSWNKYREKSKNRKKKK